jgi:hypothetical protein
VVQLQAHPYVDILHRAALMYAFASLVVRMRVLSVPASAR